MKFMKFAVLAAALTIVPSALATQIYGTFSVSGSATITGAGTYPNDYATKIAFTQPTTNVPAITSIHYKQSPGGYITNSASDDFTAYNFGSSSAVWFTPGASDTTVDYRNRYTTHVNAAYTIAAPSVANGGTTNTPAASASTSYSNYVLAAPLQFFTISQGANTITFYLTQITSTTLPLAAKTSGSGQHAATTGQILGIGYVMLNSDTTSITYGNFSLTNSTPGAGKQSFSATFTAVPPIVPTPEPGSLALLGTGAMGVAGLLSRKRRVL